MLLSAGITRNRAPQSLFPGGDATQLSSSRDAVLQRLLRQPLPRQETSITPYRYKKPTEISSLTDPDSPAMDQHGTQGSNNDTINRDTCSEGLAARGFVLPPLKKTNRSLINEADPSHDAELVDEGISCINKGGATGGKFSDSGVTLERPGMQPPGFVHAECKQFGDDQNDSAYRHRINIESDQDVPTPNSKDQMFSENAFMANSPKLLRGRQISDDVSFPELPSTSRSEPIFPSLGGLSMERSGYNDVGTTSRVTQKTPVQLKDLSEAQWRYVTRSQNSDGWVGGGGRRSNGRQLNVVDWRLYDSFARKTTNKYNTTKHMLLRVQNDANRRP